MQDDIVEAMARAIAAVEYAGANVQIDAQLADEEIRAMARAILPIAMEHAAGIAEVYADNEGMANAGHIATAIRAAGQP